MRSAHVEPPQNTRLSELSLILSLCLLVINQRYILRFSLRPALPYHVSKILHTRTFDHGTLEHSETHSCTGNIDFARLKASALGT